MLPKFKGGYTAVSSQ